MHHMIGYPGINNNGGAAGGYQALPGQAGLGGVAGQIITTQLGQPRPEVSISQGATMVFNQSENLLALVTNILARLDVVNSGKGECGAQPEMPASYKLSTAFNNMTQAETILNQISTKLFG